jgi:hypothetical protein
MPDVSSCAPEGVRVWVALDAHERSIVVATLPPSGGTTTRAARTLRRRLLSIPGRLTRHARGWTLHLPTRWPWHGDYINALNRIRALPAAA